MTASRTAIVTGAASGIGAATVSALVQEGYRVVAVDRDFGDPSRTDQVVEVPLDVRDERGCVSLVASQEEPPALLVNAAAVRPDAPILEHSADMWRTAFDVNVLGAFNLLRAVVPQMSPGGSIVNVASGAALGKRGLAAYGASKAALISMSRTAAIELQEAGVRVNVVIPGSTETPMFAVAGSVAGGARNVGGRVLSAADVAGGIVRTAHDPMLSGAAVPVGLLPATW